MPLSEFYPHLQGWTPVNESEPARAPQIDDRTTTVNPRSRTTVPLPFIYSPDTLRQYNRPDVSSFRVSPLPPAAQAQVNAATISTASKTIGSAVSIGLLMPKEYEVLGSRADATGTFNVSWLPELPGTVLASPSSYGSMFSQVAYYSAVTPQLPATIHMVNQAGNLLVCYAKCNLAGTAFPAIVDTNGNTWKVMGTGTDSGNIPFTAYYTYNVKGGSNSITISLGGSHVSVFEYSIYEYSGIVFDSDPLDQFSIGPWTSNILAAGPHITTVSDKTLVVAALFVGGAVTNPSAGPGWVERRNNTLNFFFEDQLTVPAGSTRFVQATNLPSTGYDGSAFIANFRTNPATNIPGFRYLFPQDIPPLPFSDFTGNISVSQMNSGINASASTFWRGDGTWVTVTPSVPPAMLVNSTPVSIDKLNLVNGGLDGAHPAWGCAINGTLDGG